MNPDFLAPLKSLVKSLGPRQTITLVAVFVAVVGLVGGSAYWMSSPEYSLLASDLDAESASALVTKLKDAKVPYELTDGGRTVRVAADRADEMRLQFAGSGLPSSGRIGYEIFDRPAFGTTEFLEQVNFRRALEGELSRTISTLSDVASARVHIAMAKDSLFADKAEAAKASVVLKLRGNKALAAGTVKAISGLVASSVESLRPESVVILDTYGRSLTRIEEAGDTTTSAGYDRQQQIERDAAQRVVALLEPVVGSGRVRVNVAARLKSDTEDVTETRFDPAPVIRSKQTTSESDSRSNTAGAAGARANLPPNLSTTPANASGTAANGTTAAATPDPSTPTPTGANANPANATAANNPPANASAPAGTPSVSGSTTGMSRTSETTNYEVGQLTSHRMSPSGQVARLSVAVILDEERVAPKAGETPVAKPRAPEELQRIQKLVSAAVGIDETRGDQLTVDSIAFDTPAEPEAITPPSPLTGFAEDARRMFRENGASALRTLGVLALAAGVIFGFLRPIARRALTLPKPPAALPSATTATAAIGAGQRAQTIGELEGRFAGELGPADDKQRMLAKRVAKLASEEPEYVARIMRTWLAEEQH